ncbi:MAG: zinc-dependent metalloprotease, partial [Phycisphaerales bacterium]|nr:zinc-dependent metalloprotease [Phycisphaerales bacterium]
MTYDIGSDPAVARARQLALIDSLRARLLDNLVDEGQSWSRIRTAYLQLWFQEVMSLWNTTGYIGGTVVSRDHNTPGARQPLTSIPAAEQRQVLDLLVSRVFSPHAYEISRELLTHLQAEKWYQPAFSEGDGSGSEEYSLHDEVNFIQFAVLSDLLFTCSQRLYDQELRTPPGTDALTLPELHRTLTEAIWAEFAGSPDPEAAARHSNHDPMVSALRRNLQREHVEQLVDLAFRDRATLATQRQPQIIATSELRTIARRLEGWESSAPDLDDYTRIHIEETLHLIRDALESTPTRPM